jgi:predicted Zn-ribbon and HTH transcriptional regulator
MGSSRRVTAQINVKGWRCERCGHVWVSKAATVRPVTCPHCKSPYWNKPRQVKNKKSPTR